MLPEFSPAAGKEDTHAISQKPLASANPNVQAGLAVVREEGFNAFTQIQVTTRAGLRRSHLLVLYAVAR